MIPDTELDTTAVEATNAAPELSAEQAALAAMDEGIDTVKPAAEPVAPAQAAEATVDATVDPAAKVEPAKDEATETEIKALGLKEGKSAERFRSMAGEIKALAPLKAEMEKAGIKDVAEIPVLVQRSKDYADLIGMVQETKATPEQYGYTLDYLKDANAAIGGDMAAAQRAYDKAAGEVAAWAQLLGKEVPGIHDPLAAHADLKQEVENGDISQSRALELAHQRTVAALNKTQREQQTTTQQGEQAAAQGRDALNQLGATLAAQDPDYARKQPYLLPTLRVITQTMPPSKWVSAAHQAYAQIPALPAVAAPVTPAAKVAIGPVRSAGPRPALQMTTDDPMEALNFGIAAANGG